MITYKITYRYAGNGVIAYDYMRSEFDSETFGKALAITAIVAIGAIALGAGAMGAGVIVVFV